MNELQVKTIEMKPAVIEFNHENIEKELQENLKKYEGLTFTSEASTELRSTLAELRKGKKAVDEYRKKIKRELNQPVLKFEEKCKELNAYFDNVITPLDEQLKTFVEQERAEKLEKLETARDEYIKKHELHDDYIDRIEIEDRYLTKSVSLKAASESIEFQVKNLKMEQDKLETDKQLIETDVKLVNAENELGFSVDAYVRLLEFDDVDTVRSQIKKDVEKELERRAEKERKEKERAERKKLEEERMELLREERQKQKERIEQGEKEKFDKAMEEVEEVAMNTYADAIAKENEEFIGIPFEESTEQNNSSLPFGDMGDSAIDLGYDSVPVFKNYTYVINANNDQLKMLHDFMNENNIGWSVENE